MKLIKKAIRSAENKIKNQQYERAEAICEQLLKIDPNNKSGLYLLGISKQKLNKSNESIDVFNKLKNLSPNDPEIYNTLGLSCLYNNDIDNAIRHFISAVNIDPKNFNAWSNLGCQFRNKKQYESSIRCLKEAIRLSKKQDDKILSNMAGSLAESLKIKKSIKYLKKAIKINPKNFSAHFDLGCSYFLDDKYEKAWKYFDYRFKTYENLKSLINNFSKNKKWHGQKIKNNKTILFFSEQGVGDTINFIRFVNDFNQKHPAVNIKILVPEEVRGLLKTNIVGEFVDKIENYDYWCSLLNIPRYLNYSKSDIKNSFKPYISPNKTCNYSQFKNLYKIGISWAGNPCHPRDKDRCCKLEVFKEIYELPNVKLFSLQKDVRPRIWPYEKTSIDLANCDNIKLINMAPYMNTWEDTASIIDGLDMVISVDTSILHLSGSMNKKTFGLIPKFPDWRWGLKDQETVWYPGIKLFRQQSYGDWKSVVVDIKKQLKIDLNISC